MPCARKRGRPALPKTEIPLEAKAAYFRERPAHHELVAINALQARSIAHKFKHVIGPHIAGFFFPDKNLVIEVQPASSARAAAVRTQQALLAHSGYHTVTIPASEARNIDKHYNRL